MAQVVMLNVPWKVLAMSRGLDASSIGRDKYLNEISVASVRGTKLWWPDLEPKRCLMKLWAVLGRQIIIGQPCEVGHSVTLLMCLV